MKKFKLFKMLAVLIVLITSLTTQVWAGGKLYEGSFKASFNGSAWNSGSYYTLHSSSSNKSPETGIDMGTLTSDFVITDISFKVGVDFDSKKSMHRFWCNIDGKDNYQEYKIWWNEYKGDPGYPTANSIDKTVATYEDASGSHFKHRICFNMVVGIW